MIDEDIEMEFPPFFDIPPPPPPPWMEEDELVCGSCHPGEQVSSYISDTFYNIIIIVVFVISMLIILFTLSLFLYRRLKKKSKTIQENTALSDLQLENIPKLSYNQTQQLLNYQNYYSNMPTMIVPIQAIDGVVHGIYESVDSNFYSDISLSLSSSSSSSYHSRYSSQDRRSSHLHQSIQEELPVTELWYNSSILQLLIKRINNEAWL